MSPARFFSASAALKSCRSARAPASSTGASISPVYERSGRPSRRPFAFRGVSRLRDDLFRRSLGDDPAPLVSRLGAQVDDPVGRLDHVEIVFDHDDRVPLLDETVEDLEQLVDVVEMQAGRRLVEDVERLARVGPGQLGGEFHPLRFAPRERRGGLPQREIIEADRAQRRQKAADAGNVLEQLVRLADRHFEHVGDRMPAIGHAQRLAVVALAVARFALDPHVGQEVHLNALLAVPLAIVAAAPRPIEAEAGRLISADPRLGQPGEQFADRIEDARVSRRVRRGRVPQRLLVDARSPC